MSRRHNLVQVRLMYTTLEKQCSTNFMALQFVQNTTSYINFVFSLWGVYTPLSRPLTNTLISYQVVFVACTWAQGTENVTFLCYIFLLTSKCHILPCTVNKTFDDNTTLIFRGVKLNDYH